MCPVCTPSEQVHHAENMASYRRYLRELVATRPFESNARDEFHRGFRRYLEPEI
jgi:hypothetical protein